MQLSNRSWSPNFREPININTREFAEHRYEYYRWMQEHAPVCRARVSVLDAFVLSRYDDCVRLLRDPRFVRNRSSVAGGRRSPFPMPKSVALMMQSMVVEDPPVHTRLRTLVQKAFTTRTLDRLAGPIDELSNRLIDDALRRRRVDLIEAYSVPIPLTVIAQLVGVPQADMPRFVESLHALAGGFSAWSLVRAFSWDLPNLARYLRRLIQRRRRSPRDDLLSTLIAAEERGDRLSEDELISMIFVLITAGYETAIHLLTNGVLLLLRHQDQLALLREAPELIEPAVEEIFRYRGAIHSTTPYYAREDLRLHGVDIRKGSVVVPLLGAGNHDPRVFAEPERFDITRSPNKHLGLGHGIHYCLGAPLARLEAKIALTNLFRRAPKIRLGVDPDQLRPVNVPNWHRYAKLPVVLE